MEETKKCPACAEEIKAEAKKCRYCGEIFDKSIEEINNDDYFSETLSKYKKWLSKQRKWSIEKIDANSKTITLISNRTEKSGFITLVLLCFAIIPGILYIMFGGKKVYYRTEILINKDGSVDVLGNENQFLAKNFNKTLGKN